MLKALLGALGFTMREHDWAAEDAAFERHVAAKPHAEAEILRSMRSMQEDQRPHVSGKLGDLDWAGRFESYGEPVTARQWLSDVKDNTKESQEAIREGFGPLVKSLFGGGD